jgi:DNA (cytosine-5)-methyltransferase 1
LAGRRIGIGPGTRSGLWSHMAFAVATIRPRMVVVENVRGLLSARAHSDLEPCPGCMGDHAKKPSLRALGAVLGDLADLGYDAVWCGLRASDVGAPHQRFRVFVVAADTRGETFPLGAGLRPNGPADVWGRRPDDRPVPTTANTGRDTRTADDTHINSVARHRGPTADADRDAVDWSVYGPAIRRWETILGRTAPAPTVAGERGGRVLSPAFVEWMMGLPAGHITGVPGLSRKAMLKLGGNGVVPHQAAAALRYLLPMVSSAVAA